MAHGASSSSSPFLPADPACGRHLGVEGGLLCQLLRSPAYNLFPKSAVFESNFIQVTKQGNWVDIHNTPTLVTLGVTSSEPCLPLPNVLLIARLTVPGESPPGGAGQPHQPSVALSRLLPLRYVRLSVQDGGRRLLRVQVVTGKVYYLRLHQEHPEAVFALWGRLADILQRGLSITTKDPAIHIPHSLVPSASSSSSSSPTQPAPEAQPLAGGSCSRAGRVGERLAGTLPHLAAAAPGQAAKGGSERSRLLSFWKRSARSKSPARDEAAGAPGWAGGEPALCEQCQGHRSGGAGEEGSLRTALRWLDAKRHGLWERDTPAGLLTLSRLSSLVAAGQQ
ncbi:Golgi-associated RAB2 interactor protein 1A [Pelodiscus sinensis]|uniref:Golgi-associated RAB2 interactor protein 1A n=1 Tax=Pelodiscus sinensis TaxID=13735 RepID=UPI003F6CF9B5